MQVGRLLLCCAVGVASGARAEQATTAEELTAPPVVATAALARPANAVTVRTGLGPWVAPEVGLAWSHRLGEFCGFSLGFYGAWNKVLSSDVTGAAPLPSDAAFLTLEPGLRALFGRSGLFLAFDVPVGWARQHSPAFSQDALVVGADVLAGFAYVFEGGLAVEVYAGPAVRLWRQSLSAGDDRAQFSLGAVALRAGLGVGYGF